MRIIIPTFGRPDTQPIYEFFTDAGQDPVLAVNHWSDAGGRDHLVIPHSNVGEVRQGILDKSHGKVLVCDDDIKLHVRTYNNKLPIMELAGVDEFLATVDKYLDKYTHIGVMDRFMGHTRAMPCENNQRFLKLVAYNTDLFPIPWPKYRLPVSEDTDFNLQLLLRGYPNAVLTSYAVSDYGQYKPGGCQRYRTDKVELECCKFLQNEYPGICSYTRSKSGDYRMRVAWKKAAAMGGL